MKFIFVCVIVNVFMLSLSCSYASITDGKDNLSWYYSDFDYQILKQFLTRKTAIVSAWRLCKKVLHVPFAEAIDIFHNHRLDHERTVTNATKCLVDCVMRKNGVMTNDGFDEAEYMSQIRQLRFNDTSFDMDEMSDETAKEMLETISKRARRLPTYDMRPIDFHYHFKCINMRPFRNHCHNLLLSYARSANKCKNIRDATDNNCESSWMTMRCIIKENRKSLFDSPFYPIRRHTKQYIDYERQRLR